MSQNFSAHKIIIIRYLISILTRLKTFVVLWSSSQLTALRNKNRKKNESETGRASAWELSFYMRSKSIKWKKLEEEIDNRLN